MGSLLLLHDPLCAGYQAAGHPERPARILATVTLLQEKHPEWIWKLPASASEEDLRRVHTAAHLERLRQPADFDADTPYLPDIAEHARRAAGGAVGTIDPALAGQKVMSLMRPPGHHATTDRAMGFCYLNSIAVAALAARARGVNRVAVWDFDAHHGNGTEAILREQVGCLYVSVHQSPGYPGTGTRTVANCLNFPVPPGSSRQLHLEALEASWAAVQSFKPELVLVSAGFDAYGDDPLTVMTLIRDDFATLGSWLRASNLPAGAVLEGGYSRALPQLIESFLAAWAGEESAT